MLRAACELDIPEILNLEELLFPNALTERMLQHELHRGQGWVASDGEKILGYILVRRDDDLLDITRLGVSEEARRQGIGRKLLEQALLEPGHVILTVKKDNAPALALYRQCGFKIVAHLSGAHAWIMKLTRASS